MSDSDTPSRPILARGAEPAAGGSPRSVPTNREALQALGADPDAVVEDILSLLSEERFQTAQRLASEAAVRFPDHRRVANVRRIFHRSGKAVRRPATEPNRREEMAWLRNPPESVRGKWVALVGSEMVAAADTLPKLAKSLRSKSLAKPALVHRVD